MYDGTLCFLFSLFLSFSLYQEYYYNREGGYSCHVAIVSLFFPFLILSSFFDSLIGGSSLSLCFSLYYSINYLSSLAHTLSMVLPSIVCEGMIAVDS